MNNSLPVADFRDPIVKAVADHSAIVITAKTGAGKSTQVPQYLINAGYDLVVTQPRRLAARTVAQRVAEERGEELGGTVGYRTSVDRQDSPSTRALFCTDGLALVRELMGANRGILVLDEVHEWNENMEVLVAWAKRQIEAGADFKVVLMSATLEAEKLASYFGGAPVIEVPGRLFPVEVQQPSAKLEDDVAELVQAGRNVLVFQPGKAEISATCVALERMEVSAEILPLHGGLDPSEQAKCFRHYARTKVVVSTNVAQTSVTIDDIDAVVDSGMERRIELADGVEGLYLKPISLADSTQRKGRAGRTKEGVYIDHCTVAESTRPDFPVAEILRKRLDQTVLRLAIAGFDMEAMEFFHQPNVSDIHDARRSLVSLGCMTQSGEVTKIGKLVNRLPVSVQYARMLVEADRLGVVGDVLTVAAIMEQGGITVPPPSRNRPDRPDWRHMVPDEHESDVCSQLSVWEQAKGMDKGEMREAGIQVRDYFRAKDLRKRLDRTLGGRFDTRSTGRREDILKAVCAGMVDHLYQQGQYGRYQNGESVERELGSASCVRNAEWLVGKPFDLQIKTRRGEMTLKLIELASKVDPAWLVEVAPQLVAEKTGINSRYEPEKDIVVSTTQVYFNGQLVREETVADGEHPEAATVFARFLSDRGELPSSLTESPPGRDLNVVLVANAERQERARQMNIRTGEETFPVFWVDAMFERYAEALSGARRVAEVAETEALRLPALDEDTVAKALKDQPDTIEVLGSELAVEYSDGFGRSRANPRVNIDFRAEESRKWLQLPDTGIYLPSGREVSMSSIVEGYGYYIEAPSSQFKEKARECLNQEQWDRWSDRPDVPFPDPVVEGSEIPLITAVYGQCVVTGQELEAFGTVRYRSSYYSSGWEVVWYRDREEAETVHANAARKLEEVRAEATQKRKLETAKAEAEVAREELRDLTGRDGWDELDYELRCEVERRRYGYLLTSTEELREHKVDTKALVAKVEAELAESRRLRERREEIEVQLNELQDLHGWPAAYVALRENGEIAVNCGKASKVGYFDISPSLGERQHGPESLDESGKERMWQQIPAGRTVTVSDYAGSGNLKSRVSFTVPEGKLEPGVWAVTEDGAMFYPVIYWNGREIIPDSVEAISVPAESPKSSKQADLSEVDLSKLFGGGAKVR